MGPCRRKPAEWQERAVVSLPTEAGGCKEEV
jgi:hypothetical protein